MWTSDDPHRLFPAQKGVPCRACLYASEPQKERVQETVPKALQVL